MNEKSWGGLGELEKFKTVILTKWCGIVEITPYLKYNLTYTWIWNPGTERVENANILALEILLTKGIVR